MPKLRKNFTAILAVVVLLSVVGFGLMLWQFNRPPFDLAKLPQMQRGMTQQQVRQILGEPRSYDATGWHYARPLAWPIVHVRFDASGRLQDYEYDH